MKILSTLITLFAASLHLSAAPPRHLIIGVAPGLPERFRNSVAMAAGELMYRGEPGTRVTVVTAEPFEVLADVRVGEGALILRQERAGLEIGRTVLGIQGATNFTAGFSVPNLLDLVARQLGATNAEVILVGPALFCDPTQPSFDFKTGWPSDGHLWAGRDRSIFSTLEREHLLEGLTVHWIVTDSIPNANHAEAVRRFWALFVATQGGALADYSPDVTTAFANALRGNGTPLAVSGPDTRDTNVVMRSRVLKVLREEEFIVASKPILITNVVTTTNHVIVTNVVDLPCDGILPRVASGNTGLGLIWTTAPGTSQRLDFDLYVHVPFDGTELSYRNPTSPHGRYFRDIRQATPQTGGDWRALWEFVELTGNQLPRELWINLYSGRGPAQGEVRVQYRGQEYRIAFAFPAVKGNEGRDFARRERSPQWLRIDLDSLIQPGRTP